LTNTILPCRLITIMASERIPEATEFLFGLLALGDVQHRANKSNIADSCLSTA